MPFFSHFLFRLGDRPYRNFVVDELVTEETKTPSWLRQDVEMKSRIRWTPNLLKGGEKRGKDGIVLKLESRMYPCLFYKIKYCSREIAIININKSDGINDEYKMKKKENYGVIYKEANNEHLSKQWNLVSP